MKLQAVARVAEGSTAAFRKQYVATKLPVVIGNFFDTAVLQKWNYALFKEKAGGHIVNVYGKENAFNNHAASQPVSSMPFGEYLDLIAAQPTELRLFLFNLLQKVPELKNDLHIHDISGGRVVKWLPFMFFGGAGSSVRNHFDIDMTHVFLSQFRGIKKVWLFDQRQSSFLYRLPFNFHSIANLAEPDYAKFPELRHLQGYEAVLHPGDTLFIPAGYWHYIQYVTEGYSVSHRALSEHLSDKIAGFRNLVITRNFDNSMRLLLRQRWYDFKVKKAYRRAEKEAGKIQQLV